MGYCSCSPPSALLPFSRKSKSTPTRTSSSGSPSEKNWGMGFLLVFFPEDDFSKKKHSSSSSSSPLSQLPPPPSPGNNNKPSIRRSNSSSSNLILTKAQSTISICALLVFITLLLFTLSTFEPTPVNTTAGGVGVSFSSRRHLSGRPDSKFRNSSPSSSSSLWAVSNLWQSHQNTESSAGSSLPSHAHALQRMGTLFLRGTKSMNDLIVVHLLEDDSFYQVRVFLRLLLHSSGLASKADVVFVFPNQSTNSSNFLNSLIQEESDAFVKLVTRYRERLNESAAAVPGSAGFDVSQFMKSNENDGGNNKKKKKKEVVRGEPIWGKRSSNNNKSSGVNNSSVAGESEAEAELNYGSVVGFDSAELDPENSLAGFFDHVPMSLRRWACYPMLLGRVRRSYKHVMLLEFRSYLIVGDPLVRLISRSAFKKLTRLFRLRRLISPVAKIC